MGCRTYEVKEKFDYPSSHIAEESTSKGDYLEDIDGLDHDPDRPRLPAVVHHQQTSHTTRTNVTAYGNSLSTVLGLTDTLLAIFIGVSQR